MATPPKVQIRRRLYEYNNRELIFLNDLKLETEEYRKDHAWPDSLDYEGYKFFKLLSTLDFTAQFVVARKIERVFRNSFQAREEAFYDHLISRFFQNALHRHKHNQICFAKRGSRPRQEPLANAI